MMELQPCPLCHSPVGLYWGDCHRISCSNCPLDFRGVGMMSKEELIKRWNTRRITVNWSDTSLVGMLRQYSALAGSVAIGHQEGATMGAAADRIEALEAEVKALVEAAMAGFNFAAANTSENPQGAGIAEFILRTVNESASHS